VIGFLKNNVNLITITAIIISGLFCIWKIINLSGFVPISELSAKWEKSDLKEGPSKSPKPPQEEIEEADEGAEEPTIEKVEEEDNEEQPAPPSDVIEGEETEAPENLPGLILKRHTD
jgi:hypothetical protein